MLSNNEDLQQHRHIFTGQIYDMNLFLNNVYQMWRYPHFQPKPSGMKARGFQS